MSSETSTLRRKSTASAARAAALRASGGDAAGAAHGDEDVAQRYQPLAVVLAALCLGIVLSRYVTPNDLHAAGIRSSLPVTCIAAVVAIAGWGVLWIRNQQRLATPCLLVGLAMTGATAHHMWWHLYAVDELGRFARLESQPVCIEAIAQGAPRTLPAVGYDPLSTIPQGERSLLRLRATSIRDGKQWRPASGNVQLLVDGHVLGVGAGDRVRVFGQLARVMPAPNPGEFDRARYARADRELCSLAAGYPDCVVPLARGSWWSWQRPIDALRRQGDEVLARHVAAPNVGLASAILLGEREQITTQRTETYITTGTVHLLVVSGLHIGFLAAGLVAALRVGWLSRRTALLLVAFLVVIYALVTGARPPTVRAAVFIGVVSLAAYSGRRLLAANAIAASALVVLALNPADLFRVGPQLSFLAVGTLAWCGSLRWFQRGGEEDPLDRLIRESRPLPVRAARKTGWWFARLFVAGAAIWLMALPLVMARFHLATPVALVLGPLLWLPVAFCLLCGFGTLLLGWLVPSAGTLFGAGCNAGLGLLERAVQFSHDVPYSHFWVPGPAEWWLAAFYAALLLVVMAPPRFRPPPRWCVGLLAGWMAVGFLPPLMRQSESDHFACTFLAVGHGSATVLELPGGRTMLYDAGRLGSPQGGARSVAAFLWSRGITRLDALVISHADADHYNSVPELLVRFPVRVAYVSPMMFEEPLPRALVALRDSLSGAGTEIREIWAGDRLATGSDVDIQVMHPPRRGVLGSDNANSLVLAVEYRGHRILLPGDLESPGLEDVTAEAPYDCDILMAPHHGSRRSDPPGFAAWSSPEYVVISGGFRDDIAPVAATYRQVAHARILHTAASGAIRFELAGERLKMKTWRANY